MSKLFGEVLIPFREFFCTALFVPTMGEAVNFITETAVAINYLSGVVTFDTPPAMGSFVTAGFEFDVPVRFASDALNISLNDFGSTQIDDIPLVEILHSGSDT